MDIRDQQRAPASSWPELRYKEWQETRDTLHLWTQIAGKVRLACTPWINHSWHVTLYVTARGLTTSLMHYGGSAFQLDFDFIDHQLHIDRADGRRARVRLYERSVADFHREFTARLRELDLDIPFHGAPNELPEQIPFAEDRVHASYDAESVNRFWRILVSSARVMTDFRGEFRGKSSPVHFFWGGFDLAVTRFSGRRAPKHPGGVPHMPDWVGREAYSHEVSSSGFWPGGGNYPHAVFYAYAYPTPAGFSECTISPASAAWSPELGEFVLPYDNVRASPDPDGTLRQFLQSTYEAAADLADWDRASLEWSDKGRPGGASSGASTRRP